MEFPEQSVLWINHSKTGESQVYFNTLVDWAAKEKKKKQSDGLSTSRKHNAEHYVKKKKKTPHARVYACLCLYVCVQ